MAHASSRSELLPPLWLFTLAALGLSLWLLVELKEIVSMLVLSYALSYLIAPLIRFLERFKISRPVSVLLVFIIFGTLLTLLVLTALPTLVEEYTNLVSNLPEYLGIARERVMPKLTRLHLVPPSLPGDRAAPTGIAALLPQISGDTLKGLFSGLFAALLQGYSLTLTIINLALLPVIVFYLTVDMEQLHEAVVRLFPVRLHLAVRALSREIDTYVSAFVRGQLLVGCILFCLYLILLGAVTQLKLWFLLAFIAGFGTMVPFIGFLTGLVLSTLMAIVTYGDFFHVLMVWGIFLVMQLLEGMVITPNIVGHRVGLHPLAIILSIVVGGALFGLLGVVLAVPGAAAIRVLLNHLHGWVLRHA